MAANPLITSELPDGYRFVGEGFVQAAGVTGLDPAKLADAGTAGCYLSLYQNPDTKGMISATSRSGPIRPRAEKGFALLEERVGDRPEWQDHRRAVEGRHRSAELTTGTAESNGATMASPTRPSSSIATWSG